MKIKDERLKNKTIISLETMAVYYKGERKTDLTAAYEYWELIDSKYVRLYVLVCRNGFVIQSYETEGDVYVVPTIFKNKEAKRRFQYLKELSGAVTLPTIDGTKGNILANHYSKITYINPESVLAKYLAPVENNTASQEADEHPVIMPFGINKSQYEAVKKAIGHQISIVEGPPGCGKTQTIMNVIANMLIRGKSVAVVSSNNAAVVNVKEKLDAAELGYTAAYLGSSNNKEAFIRSQENVSDDLYSWRISPKEKEASSNAIRTGVEKSLESLEIETNLAIKRQELTDLEAEIQQFEKTVGCAAVSDRFETKDDILTFMAEWERVSTSKGFISKVKCAAGFIVRYKWIGIRTLIKAKSRDAESLQRSYYTIAKENLTTEIARLEAELDSSGLEVQIKRLSINSFFLLKGILANQYCTEKERRKYTLEDLWKKPNEFVSDYPVILSTTFSLRTSLNSNVMYDCLIVDEASQVDLVTGALAMSCCAKKIIIVGDTKQLPNVVDSKMKAQADIIYDKYKVERAYEYTNNSLLTSAMKVFPDAPKTLLREHYRCHPDIIGFCNKKFYNNELIIMSQKNSEVSPLHVIKTVKGNHARGRINKRQIDVVLSEVVPDYLFSESLDVGVIAPYRKQVTAIKEELKSAGVEGVQVDTVHKYQGREKDTIILSTVDNTATEFADQDHMMNVAVSRARNKLVVVASSEADKGQSNLAQLIRYAEYKNGTITESNIRSIFDYLYADYEDARNRLLTDADKISEYDSENLMYKLLKDEICSKRSEYGIAAHVPMRMVVKDTGLLNDKRLIKYASHPWTHFDFTVYNKITKEIVLVIEVDGTAYHKENSKQSVRDGMKDEIAKIYSIPLIRIKTDESGVLEKIEQALVDRQVS